MGGGVGVVGVSATPGEEIVESEQAAIASVAALNSAPERSVRLNVVIVAPGNPNLIIKLRDVARQTDYRTLSLGRAYGMGLLQGVFRNVTIQKQKYDSSMNSFFVF